MWGGVDLTEIAVQAEADLVDNIILEKLHIS